MIIGFRCLFCVFFSTAPVKRVKKLYVDDQSVEVPERTTRRWKQLNAEINQNNQLCTPLVSSNELNSLLGTYNETFLSRIYSFCCHHTKNKTIVAN